MQEYQKRETMRNRTRQNKKKLLLEHSPKQNQLLFFKSFKFLIQELSQAFSTNMCPRKQCQSPCVHISDRWEASSTRCRPPCWPLEGWASQKTRDILRQKRKRQHRVMFVWFQVCPLQVDNKNNQQQRHPCRQTRPLHQST